MEDLKQEVEANGGVVRGQPQLDQGERWLVELEDPAGNRIGLVAPVRAPRSQTMIAVSDVEASSRWYQQLLGLRSDHGGPHYERLLAGGELVLQLHHRHTEHDHGPLVDPDTDHAHTLVHRFADTARVGQATLSGCPE